MTSLDLHNNRLSSLPPEIGQLTRLKELYLHSNELTSLPLEIEQLPLLTRVDLSNNRFDSLSEVPVFLLRRGAGIDGNPFLKDQSSRILRSIEFPPEYKTAGMSVLSYFGRFVEQKYPGLDVAVSIQQEGNMVSMTIETPDGNRETVEKALEEYALVVTEKKAPEEVLDDKSAILELKSEIRLRKAQIETLRDIERFKDATIAGLNHHLAAAINKESPAPPTLVIDASSNAIAKAQATVDFQTNLGNLQGTLSELAYALPEGEERQIVQETAAALEEIEGESDPAKVRRSRAWSTFRRLYKRLSDGKDTLRKTIEDVKDGRDIVNEIREVAQPIFDALGGMIA